MKKFLIISLLICSATLISGAISLKNSEKFKKKVPVPVSTKPLTVTITPTKDVKQGQTVFININSRYTLKNPHIVFDNNKIKIFKNKDNTYVGLIGLDAMEKPGSHKVLIADDTGNLSERRTINVISGKFPIQNIVISGSKSGLEATKYELAKVQQAKYTLSDTNFWSIENDDIIQVPPYNMPTKGCIISVYGLTRYHNGISTGDFHKGLDIKAPQGQRINTIAAGKILIARQFRLHGGTVAVDHGQGIVSIYLHMSKISVKEGQIVKADQKIGEVGSTGFATGPHLHWGLYINGIPVNPMEFWVKKVNKC